MAKRLGKTNKLWISWGLMYGICAVCSFINTQQSDPRGVMLMLLGMLFFVPPAWIVAYSVKKKRRKPLVIVRNISIFFLAATLVMTLVAMLTVNASEAVWQVLDCILVFVSVPGRCLQIQFAGLPVIGLFGWACLMMACFNYIATLDGKHYGKHHRKHRSGKK